MKKLSIIILAFTLGLSGCDLLDIKPVNSMLPKSVEDFESLLLGGYPRTEFFMRTESATDNVYLNPNSSYAPNSDALPFYIWADSHQSAGTEDSYWKQLYQSIFYANTVLDEFAGKTVTDAERELFETVRGEAYTLRAYCYFYLVNYYAETYEEANLDLPGVPMPLSAEDIHQNTQNNVRVPVGQVWEQILSDLEAATRDLAGKGGKSEFRFDYTSLQALKARVYLFMHDYDQAIACAKDVISSRALCDMNTLQAHIDTKGDKYAFSGNVGFVDTDYKKEILFFVGGRANNNMYYYSTYSLKPSQELMDLCYRNPNDSTQDYRRYIFEAFSSTEAEKATQGPTVYRMFATQEKYCYYFGLKASEAYVTLAECYARKGNRTSAVEILNRLLKSRYKTSAYVALNAADFTDATLLARVLEERRLELAFDAGMRWMDLRRLGKPELTHVYQGEVLTLQQGDLRYVLQIPQSEQENSPNMPLNPRLER